MRISLAGIFIRSPILSQTPNAFDSTKNLKESISIVFRFFISNIKTKIQKIYLNINSLNVTLSGVEGWQGERQQVLLTLRFPVLHVAGLFRGHASTPLSMTFCFL